MEPGSEPEQQADSAPAETSALAELSAGVTGRVAAGDYVVAVHPDHGALLEPAEVDVRPVVRPRRAPMRAPRAGRELLGREVAIDRAVDAIEAGTPVELVGPPGIGKSALLRHLAHHGGSSDGVVYVRAGSQPLEDILALLFDAFYETDLSYAPDAAELRMRLQARGGLILVDDLESDGADPQALLDSAPGCGFVVATTEPRLDTPKRELRLDGLSEDAALALFERELGRRAREAELDLASDVCRRVAGRPLLVIQAAAAVREREASLAELAAGGQWDGWPGQLAEPQRLALAALVGLGGAPVRPIHVEAIASVAGAGDILEGLRDRGLVEVHGSGYTLAAPLGEEAEDRERWAARALDHFAEWAPVTDPARLQEDVEALMAALRWGAANQRWPQVLGLASALEGPLALSGRWGSWETAIHAALEAARAEGDQAAEGWALNQLGVRAACRGDDARAREHLEQALRAREEIDDGTDAAVTRHNLEVLSARAPRRARVMRGPWLALLGAVLGAVGGVAVVLAVGSGGGGDERRAEQRPPTATVTGGRPAGQSTTRTTSPRPPARTAAPERPPTSGGTSTKADLVVVRARAVPTGAGCAVRWTVRNRGGARAAPQATALSWALATGESGTNFEGLPALAAGAQRQQEKVSRGYTCGEFASLTVRADPGGRVTESNEANNRRAAR